MFDLRKIFFSQKVMDSLAILEQFLGFFQFFFQLLAWYSTIQFIFLKKICLVLNQLPKFTPGFGSWYHYRISVVHYYYVM